MSIRMQASGNSVQTNTALCRIESLNCSKCKNEISYTSSNSSNSIWYYYLIKSSQPNEEIQVSNTQERNPQERETRFICQICKKQLQSEQFKNQYVPMLQSLHCDQIIDEDNVHIKFQQDYSETRQAPQEAKLIENQMFCEKCLQNQITIRDFDLKLKKCVELHKENAIKVAVMLAKEENEYDQKVLKYLRIRLSNANKPIEKALILNKISNILKKYPQQQ